ncbi:MAG TPA: UDP-N-acetylenolpyruvoylglucosamine reductase [Rhodospirillaceae bacterium]|nr:UDP-N-acetylenolpyruvoylglucosamine reductase [Rhodospirillaceae bacterium]
MSFEDSSLLEQMPPVRGKMAANAPLKDQTWFRVGGPAEVLFRPEDFDDLAAFLNGCPKDVPLTVIGAASNLLIRDGGVAGVVIKLGPAFASITAEGDKIKAGAAAMDVNIARAAQKEGIAGLEFFSGIPGTLGGALRMNAGAHGSEVKDVVQSISALDRHGNKHTMTPKEMGFAYRHSDAPADWIFTGAILQGRTEDIDIITERMSFLGQTRGESQPVRERTGGSTFANPKKHKAWELIDKAGCRGLKMGGAMVSDKHCNFLINTGSATAADIEALGEEVRRRVLEEFDIELRWEIRRIGLPQKKT